MELYHIHTKNNHDSKWQENKIIEVRKNFKNRLYKRCNNFTVAADIDNYKNLSNIFNSFLMSLNMKPFTDKINVSELLSVYLANGTTQEEAVRLLQETANIMHSAAMFKREMALENYRKENRNNIPGRMNSIYLTDEESISHWIERLNNNDLEIFQVEPYEEPFKTYESLIPEEQLNYEDTYKEAYKYWYPKKKYDINDTEYLAQGKIKILKKVNEIKKNMV